MDEQAISFGPYRLLAAERLLLEGDQPVRLGSRAFDILATLLQRPGEVIGKDELISLTWPKTFVEDANLKIQISALRRALGDGQGGRRYIATIPGRGYNFVAPVRFEKPAEASLAATIASATAHNLPLAATRMIGREEVVATLVSRLSREHEHRLGPLGSPPTSSGLTAAEAAAFPAVQLFVERVTGIVDDFALTDANALLVSEICSRLDGLPLAIEFAAPRVEVLGVEGLAARLDQSLPLFGTRRRATTARHRTMRAVVDWSYSLLREDEQHFFRALGIFAGGFTVEAAAAVVLDAAKTRMDAIDRLADLVAKSLVVADVSEAKPRFRLLDTTRAYAIEKLDQSAERDQIARRHAEYHRQIFGRAEVESVARRTDEWLADYAREIDNLRSALDWAFSPGGEAAIGVALTAAAVPLWMRLSLPEECRGRAERALGALGAGASWGAG